MDGDELAEMEERRKLPIELKGLVDFLDWEEAPTAIVRIGETVEAEDVMYLNPAFTQLVERKQKLADLWAAIRRSWNEEEKTWGLHGKKLDGKRWITRMTGEYCIATATGERNNTENIAADGATLINGHGTHEENDTSQSLDWTRHPIPTPSPWIDFIRTVDWESTAVGPMSSWCPTLRQYMLHIMSNPEPRLIIWGDDMTYIYNEACVELTGAKHPHSMGKNFYEAWPELVEPMGPMIKAAYDGQVVKVEDSLQFVERHGYLEEAYWNFAMIPVVGPNGHGMGMLHEFTEITQLVTGDRRRQFVNRLSEKMQTAATLESVWAVVLECIEFAGQDLPFAMLYSVDHDLTDHAVTTSSNVSSSAESQQTSRPKKCVLAGTVGVADDNVEAVKTFALSKNADEHSSIASHCLKACTDGKAVHLSTSEGTLPVSLRGPIPDRSFDEEVRAGMVCPIGSATTSDIVAVLVVGLNPRLPFNSEYKIFLHVAVEMIEKAAALISLPEEQRRAQKLADDLTTALTQQLRLSNIQAEKSEAKFSRMADSAPIGMFMFGPDGKTIYTNQAYKELLGVDSDRETAITSQKQFNSWGELLHADDLDVFLTAWARVTDEKVPITIEYRLKRPWSSIDKSTGQNTLGETWLHATAFPEIAADGSVVSVQGWLSDISHRKFSENLLSQELEDALENKRQTENFIDMTSHEMRNPLSAILQSADSILSTLTSNDMPIINEDLNLSADVAEEIIDAAQVIVLCAQHQKRIVDDILTLSKLDASLLVISPNKVQVPALIKKALKMYEAEIERAEIDAQLVIEPTYEDLKVDWVVLDPSRLLQVVINLLTNAIKFTQYSPTRKIKICIGASRQRPSGQHHGISFVPQRFNRPCNTPAAEWGHGEDIYLQVAVYDTGRGLNDDEMRVLFGRFQQASPKTYQQYGGSGLGLFISRELCELQCGQIGVSSRDGQTVFTFYVRAKRWLNDDHLAQSSAAKPFVSTSASPMAYSRRGSVAMNPPQDQMEPSAPLPDGSTITTFKPLSRKSSHTSTTPLKVVSEQGLKQMDTATMTSLTAATSAASIKPPQLHVLIVEDNTINARVLSQQLRRAGCVVHVANHGGECLEFLDRSSFCPQTSSSTPTSPTVPPTPLSIILLDLEMPIMDGLTCIRHIRKRQANGRLAGHVPVIAVTANARSEQIHFAIEAGMDQVVTKPFRIPELVPRMESLVEEVLAGMKMTGG